MNASMPPPSSPNNRLHRVPVHTLAHRLGQAGLVPFVVFALLLWVVTEEALPYVALTLVAYAALIVSFLGGIHWGLVWVRQAGVSGIPPLTDHSAKLHLLWGVVPSLLAWPGPGWACCWWCVTWWTAAPTPIQAWATGSPFASNCRLWQR
jgi:hypothetical protein